MLTFQLKYRNKIKDVTLYHIWDLDPEDIFHYDGIQHVTRKDKWQGKYIKWNDGTELYSKLVWKTSKAFITEAGIYKLHEPINIFKVTVVGANYSGVKSRDEHPIVRKATKSEVMRAYMLLNTHSKVKEVTPRIKYMVKERIKKLAKDNGVTEDYLIKKTVEQIESPRAGGMVKLTAIKMLSNVIGLPMEQPKVPSVTVQQQPLFNINQAPQQVTGGNDYKLDTTKELKLELQDLGITDLPEVDKRVFAQEISPDQPIPVKDEPEHIPRRKARRTVIL